MSDAHFFVPFERRNLDRGKEFYEGLFSGASPHQLKVESDEHIVLPLLHPVLRAAATTIESVVEASALVKQTVPDAKIILIIRNQLDLILSRYGEYIMSGRDVEFAEFVEEFLCSSKDQRNYFQNYYTQIIGVFQKDFSPQNVLVLLQEELSRNEPKVIKQICDFLDIHIPKPKSPTNRSLNRYLSLEPFRVVARSGSYSKNAGLSYNGLKAMRLWNRFVVEPEEAYYRKATAKLPYPLYKFGVRAIRVLDYYMPKRIKGNKKALLTIAISERVRKEFNDDNRQLERLLSRDLGPLGY